MISRESLPHIANSDFHRPEHLYAWKTLLNAEKTPRGRARRAAARHRDRRAAPDARRGGGDRVNALAVGRAGSVGLAVGVAAYVVSAAIALRSRRRRAVPRRTGSTPPASRSSSRSAESTRASRRTSSRSSGSTTALVRGRLLLRVEGRSGLSPSPAASRTGIRRSRASSSSTSREPGGNAKVNRLTAALRHARHRLILFSDGNVRVRPGLPAARRVLVRRPARRPRVAPLPGAAAPPSLGLADRDALPERLPAGRARRCSRGRAPDCRASSESRSWSRAAPSTRSRGSAPCATTWRRTIVLGREVRRPGSASSLSADVLDTIEVRKKAPGGLGAAPALGDDAAPAGAAGSTSGELFTGAAALVRSPRSRPRRAARGGRARRRVPGRRATARSSGSRRPWGGASRSARRRAPAGARLRRLRGLLGGPRRPRGSPGAGAPCGSDRRRGSSRAAPGGARSGSAPERP